jgi:hypothetical protein
LEVVQIKEAGHGIPYDQPEQFSATIQTFLRNVKTYEKRPVFCPALKLEM